MTLTRLLPGPPAEIDLGGPDAADLLDGLYRPPRARWLRLNFVASVNGSVAGSDGTSQSLTNRTDRRILGAIRRAADAVLVGASSVRTEGYLLPRSATLVILTGSGDLTGHRIPADAAPGRVLVLCPPEAVGAVRASLGETEISIVELTTGDHTTDEHGGPRIDPAQAVAALHRLGHESIVCEGGPSLAAQLVDADLVDELCLSTSPQLLPLDAPLLPRLATGRRLGLEQLLVDEESTLYARWVLRS